MFANCELVDRAHFFVSMHFIPQCVAHALLQYTLDTQVNSHASYAIPYVGVSSRRTKAGGGSCAAMGPMFYGSFRLRLLSWGRSPSLNCSLLLSPAKASCRRAQFAFLLACAPAFSRLLPRESARIDCTSPTAFVTMAGILWIWFAPGCLSLPWAPHTTTELSMDCAMWPRREVFVVSSAVWDQLCSEWPRECMCLLFCEMFMLFGRYAGVQLSMYDYLKHAGAYVSCFARPRVPACFGHSDELPPGSR